MCKYILFGQLVLQLYHYHFPFPSHFTFFIEHMVIKYPIFTYQELWVSRRTIFLSNLVTVHQDLEEQCQKVSDDHSVHTEISFQLKLKFLEVFLNVFILFLAALHLLCCARAFSRWGKWGDSSCGAQASHCGGFSCRRAQALGLKGFSSCGVQA